MLFQALNGDDRCKVTTFVLMMAFLLWAMETLPTTANDNNPILPLSIGEGIGLPLVDEDISEVPPPFKPSWSMNDNTLLGEDIPSLPPQMLSHKPSQSVDDHTLPTTVGDNNLSLQKILPRESTRNLRAVQP